MERKMKLISDDIMVDDMRLTPAHDMVYPMLETDFHLWNPTTARPDPASIILFLYHFFHCVASLKRAFNSRYPFSFTWDELDLQLV